MAEYLLVILMLNYFSNITKKQNIELWNSLPLSYYKLGGDYDLG